MANDGNHLALMEGGGYALENLVVAEALAKSLNLDYLVFIHNYLMLLPFPYFLSLFLNRFSSFLTPAFRPKTRKR